MIFFFRKKSSLFAPSILRCTGVTRYHFSSTYFNFEIFKIKISAGLCSDFPHQLCPPKVVAKLSISPNPLTSGKDGFAQHHFYIFVKNFKIKKFEKIFYLKNSRTKTQKWCWTLNFVFTFGEQNWRNHTTQNINDYTTTSFYSK